MIAQTLEQALNEIVEGTGAPTDLLSRLRDEDDWSFVVKLHALIEAVVTNMLTKILDDDRLEAIFSEMELSNKKTGKMAFVKQMKLMPEKHRRFIHSLSELRNACVHKVANISFDLKSHVKTLNKQQWTSFVKSFAFFYDKQEIIVENMTVRREDMVKETPKIIIWLGAVEILKDLYIEKQKAHFRIERRNKYSELMERISKESFLRMASRAYSRGKSGTSINT